MEGRRRNGRGLWCVLTCMELQKSQPSPQGDGCLVGVVRIPVKIVAVLIVLPVRVVWDLLAAAARMLHRTVLGPLWEQVLLPVLRGLGWVIGALLKAVFYWPWVGLWRYAVVPVGQGLAWCGRGVYAYALRPLGQGIGWLARGVHTYLLRPLGDGLFRYLLRPVGKGLAWAGWALGMTLFVWPWVGLWRFVLVPVGRYVLLPLGRAAAWLVTALVTYLLVLPAQALWRYVAAPLGRGVYAYLLVPLGRLLVSAWHLAGRVSRALWRGLVWLWRGLVVRPAVWVRRHVVTPLANVARVAARSVHRQVLTPVGNAVRDVWRTSRLAVREARADVRRALFGGTGREPVRSRARTLGSNTAAGDAPAPEISLHKQG